MATALSCLLLIRHSAKSCAEQDFDIQPKRSVLDRSQIMLDSVRNAGIPAQLNRFDISHCACGQASREDIM